MRKKYTLPVGNVVVFDEGKRWEGQDPMTGFVAEKKKIWRNLAQATRGQEERRGGDYVSNGKPANTVGNSSWISPKRYQLITEMQAISQQLQPRTKAQGSYKPKACCGVQVWRSRTFDLRITNRHCLCFLLSNIFFYWKIQCWDDYDNIRELFIG